MFEFYLCVVFYFVCVHNIVCVCVYTFFYKFQNSGGSVLQPQNVSTLQPQQSGSSAQLGDQTKVSGFIQG